MSAPLNTVFELDIFCCAASHDILADIATQLCEEVELCDECFGVERLQALVQNRHDQEVPCDPTSFLSPFPPFSLVEKLLGDCSKAALVHVVADLCDLLQQLSDDFNAAKRLRSFARRAEARQLQLKQLQQERDRRAFAVVVGIRKTSKSTTMKGCGRKRALLGFHQLHADVLGIVHQLLSWDKNVQLKWTAHETTIFGIVLSPDGRSVLTYSRDQTLKLWCTANGTLLRQFRGHTDIVSKCGFAPSGDLLLSASFDGTVKLWKTSGNLLRSIESHEHEVTAVCFSFQEDRILSAGDDGDVKMWGVSTGTLERAMPATPSGDVWCCAFSPNGLFFVTGHADATLKLYSASTYEIQRSFDGHSGIIWTCTFSECGSTLLSGSQDTTMILWNVQSGQVLRTLEGHTRPVGSCSWHGSTILSASGDKTVMLWEGTSGRLRRVIEGFSARAPGCAMSADGPKFVAVEAGGVVARWGRGGEGGAKGVCLGFSGQIE
jgi:WD40 repeat protein